MAKTLEDLKVGDYVCVNGQGTALGAHRHNVVAKITKTQIVTTAAGNLYVERFRRDGNDVVGLRSIPYSAWGGSSAFATCQRKKNAQAPRG